MPDCDELLTLARRVMAHVRAGTTDQAVEAIMSEKHGYEDHIATHVAVRGRGRTIEDSGAVADDGAAHAAPRRGVTRQCAWHMRRPNRCWPPR